MDHEMVVQQKTTERYLLNELDSESREEFEEHFFDCPECAFDVRLGCTFVDRTKSVLGKISVAETAASSIRTATRVDRGWLSWLRPVFAAPALALLLLVVGYQNLVTYPRLQRSLSRPQVLPWAPVNIGTWGSGHALITASPGQGFLLFVRIPPEGGYSHYTANLYNPAGKMEWSLTIPAIAGQDQWPVQIPGSNREAGTYTMAVRGVTAAGESKEVGRTSFELKIQN
jgi:hypothetical protein